MKIEWPLVDPMDDGIRPAGSPDECFYCRQKIGEPHKDDCVIVTGRVKVRWSFDVEVDLPYSWTADEIKWFYEQSSWCANNALDELIRLSDDETCLCGRLSAEVLRIGTEPARELRKQS